MQSTSIESGLLNWKFIQISSKEHTFFLSMLWDTHKPYFLLQKSWIEHGQHFRPIGTQAQSVRRPELRAFTEFSCYSSRRARDQVFMSFSTLKTPQRSSTENQRSKRRNHSDREFAYMHVSSKWVPYIFVQRLTYCIFYQHSWYVWTEFKYLLSIYTNDVNLREDPL